jgi:hypothetical protein
MQQEIDSMENHMKTLMRQAVAAVDSQYRQPGYALRNPHLVSALLRAASSTYRPSREAPDVEQD